MVAKLLVFSAPVLGFLVSVVIGIADVFKLHKIFSPLAFIVRVFPSAVGLFVVLRTVRKSKSNTAFLFNQILWGAIPGYITVAVLNMVLSASAFGAVVAGNYIFNVTLPENATNVANSSIATNASLGTVPLLVANASHATNARFAMNATLAGNASLAGNSMLAGNQTLAGNAANPAARNGNFSLSNRTTNAITSALLSRRTFWIDTLFVAAGRNAIHETAKLILGLRVLGEIHGGVVPTVRFITASFCAPTVGILGSPAILGGILGCKDRKCFVSILRGTLLSSLRYVAEIGTACLIGLTVSKRVMLGTNAGNGRVLALSIFISHLSNQGVNILKGLGSVNWDKEPKFSYLWYSIEVGWLLSVSALLAVLCWRSYAQLAPARYGRISSEAHRS